MYMALGMLLSGFSPITLYDRYTLPSEKASTNACQVRIHCPGKQRTIYAMLSEGFVISSKSEWKSLFGSGGSGVAGADLGKVIGIIDNSAQFIAGYTLRQPYFGRKYWCGTDPLKFSLTFQFVSFSDAKADVYDPMVSLLSLLYPRKSSLDETAHLFEAYFIPGPNLFYNVSSGSNGDDGDRVEITMGNFLSFKGCYINSVSFHVENSFSTDGYPNCVKAEMAFETMDVAFVNGDGAFMEKGFGDASVDIGDGVASLKELANHLFEEGKNLVTKTKDVLSGFLSLKF